MAASAALAAKRRKAKQERQRRERDEKLVKERKQVEGWFKMFDIDNSNSLDKYELAKLFRHIEPACEVDDTIGEFLLQRAFKDLDHPQGEDLQVSPENVARVVSKYRHYLKQKVYLDELFEKYDKDKSGFLTADELELLMKDKARGAAGMSMEVEVTEEDVQYVLDSCGDSNVSGIPRLHLLSAVGEWHEIATVKREQKKKSTFCNVL